MFETRVALARLTIIYISLSVHAASVSQRRPNPPMNHRIYKSGSKYPLDELNANCSIFYFMTTPKRRVEEEKRESPPGVEPGT